MIIEFFPIQIPCDILSKTEPNSADNRFSKTSDLEVLDFDASLMEGL